MRQSELVRTAVCDYRKRNRRCWLSWTRCWNSSASLRTEFRASVGMLQSCIDDGIQKIGNPEILWSGRIHWEQSRVSETIWLMTNNMSTSASRQQFAVKKTELVSPVYCAIWQAAQVGRAAISWCETFHQKSANQRLTASMRLERQEHFYDHRLMPLQKGKLRSRWANIKR